MVSREGAMETRWTLEHGPGRAAAGVDILIYFGAALGLFGIEEGLRAADLWPFPPMFNGGLTQIASFFVVFGIMKWRGQSWRAFGLRKPRRLWLIPTWALAVFAVNVVAQVTVVPLLATLLNLPSPDLTRYDALHQNFPLLLVALPGMMFTGGFIEEYIYRGLMIDRFARLFGGGRRGLVWAALLNGLPFGLIHFEWGLGGIFVTTVMGSVLGLMYLATRRNLWPLIVAHASLDAILALQVYFVGTNLG